MKNKALTICLFILFALPIPVALLGGLLTFMWFLGSLMQTTSFLEILLAFFGMVLGYGYIFTYWYALNKTRKESKISIKTFFPLFHCLIAVVYLISISNSPLESVSNPVIASLPAFENSECYQGEGFQDYTDYCKYYFKDEDFVDKLEKNEYLKKVSISDTAEIKSYFENFEGWVQDEEYKDNYDFSAECIDTEDYFYIENKDTCEKYKDYPNKYSAYNVYFFDVQTQTLYYIHSNI